jgi:hypothetical protein
LVSEPPEPPSRLFRESQKQRTINRPFDNELRKLMLLQHAGLFIGLQPAYHPVTLNDHLDLITINTQHFSRHLLVEVKL